MPRWNMTYAWLQEHLKIQEADTLTLRDNSPYQYRFLDTPSVNTSPKYKESVYISDLVVSTKRLIHVGTLFGSSRLRLRLTNNISLRGKIRQGMSFSNPDLISVADAIKRSFGGPFLGAHIRLGDGQFKANSKELTRLIWWKLVHSTLKFSFEDTWDLERISRLSSYGTMDPNSIVHDLAGDLRSQDLNLSLPSPSNQSFQSLGCRGHRHAVPRLDLLNIPLFISTDVKDPDTSPLLQRFRQTFPCTFFLADFSTETALLDNLRNDYDGVMLKEFLLPFLDAMVTGKAWKVVGTDNSTFSRFVQDVLWRTYHGHDIVQRG